MRIIHVYRLATLLGVLTALLIGSRADAQRVALKTNLPYLAATSPNLGLELRVGRHSTIDLGGGMSLWKFDEATTLKHWLVQPEYRYWICEPMNGHFVGLHLHGGQYNIGGINIPIGRLKKLKEERYQGYFYGAGLSYGYQWVLSSKLNLEASLGGGYARVWYELYPCAACGNKFGEGFYNYWGLTRATLSLVYFLN